MFGPNERIKISSAEINDLFGITESFMLPGKLMQILFGDRSECKRILRKFTEMQGDLTYDGFTDYFQEEHSNRKAMMQDFTPKELAELVAKIAGSDVKTALDVCSGTGGLTIALHAIAPECEFYCEELSERALPILLFNLAVRNIPAYVSRKNVLSNEAFECYRVIPGEHFGEVHIIGSIPDTSVDVCITNPPYSLKFDFEQIHPDSRFDEYGYPPKQFSDMGFIIHGLKRLKSTGRCIAILPHGVLFRNSREADIRRKMLENGNYHAVIGMPENLFLNTCIPVAVIVYGKQPTERVVFIDGSKGFEKVGKINRLRAEDIEKILCTLMQKKEVPKYSHITGISEIAENDYNLLISRYVDTYEPPPPINIVDVAKELYELEQERIRLELEIYASLIDLKAGDKKEAAELEAAREIFGKLVKCR